MGFPSLPMNRRQADTTTYAKTHHHALCIITGFGTCPLPMNSHFFDKRVAHLLGLTGLIPFALLSLAAWVVHPGWLGMLVRTQLGYGIALLSFLGGIHWGAALACGHLSVTQAKKALIWGVAPSILAFGSLLLEIGFGFAILMFGFIGAYQVDRRLYHWYKMPEWLLALRFTLTCVVVTALAVTFIAVNVRN
jgi:hypothetical protein